MVVNSCHELCHESSDLNTTRMFVGVKNRNSNLTRKSVGQPAGQTDQSLLTKARVKLTHSTSLTRESD